MFSIFCNGKNIAILVLTLTSTQHAKQTLYSVKQMGDSKNMYLILIFQVYLQKAKYEVSHITNQTHLLCVFLFT